MESRRQAARQYPGCRVRGARAAEVEEFQMRNRRTLSVAVLIVTLLAFPPELLATKTIAPQIGTWAIDEEVDGKPGRGFQMDVQNDVLVLYFYGYEPTGRSSFWLAAGRLAAGSDVLTADLGEYAGGMAFGDPRKSATYLGSRGTVTIRFVDRDHGEICLPGEACKAISAFNFGYEQNASELLGGWLVYGDPPGASVPEASEFAIDRVEAATRPGATERALGRSRLSIGGAPVVVDLSCDRLVDGGEWEFFCRVGAGPAQEMYLSVDRNGFTGRYYDRAQNATAGNVYGFRSTTPAGRVVLPN